MRKVNSVDLAGLNDFFDTAQMNMKNTKPKLNMDRDDIMHLVNETAPRYESWGCEAHFQLFAQRLIEREREAMEELRKANEAFGKRQEWWTERMVDLEAQLKEAVEAEREACAKVCDWRYMGDNNREDMEARRCAAAIRARGEE